ncbi:MAG TPA: diguanylate cyclase, partial [Solirubrobacterales bacterium]|nr:diguanylate cyclase [Solirubrobacterales bacterium]
TIDREGFILEADGIWASLGWSPDELIGRSITEMLAADDRSAALALNAQVFDLGPLTDFRQRFQARDGSWHWLNWNAVVDPEQDKLFASARDVTEQVALERKLAAESEKLRQVQSLARTGSFDSDVATGEVTWSDELRGIFGVGPDDPLPTVAEFERLIRAEDVPGVIEGYRIVEEDGRDATFEFRLNRPNKHGDVVHLALRVTAMRDDNGAVVRVFGAAIDISERKTMEQQLQFLAEHDPLTAMPNRRRFGSELESHLSHARRYGSPGAVLMVDLDNLKSVNDELGHQAGDELIRAAAAAMKTRLREHDLLARIGGDEFAVLLPRANRAEARVLAEALLEAIGARSVTLHSTGVTRVTASIGISVLSDLQELTAEAAIAAADTAMYDAKSSGRDRLVVFDHLRHLEFMPHTLGSEPA